MDTDCFVFEIQERTNRWLDKQSPEKKGRIKTKNAILSKKQVSKPYGTSQRVVGYRGCSIRSPDFTYFYVILCAIIC